MFFVHTTTLKFAQAAAGAEIVTPQLFLQLFVPAYNAFSAFYILFRGEPLSALVHSLKSYVLRCLCISCYTSCCGRNKDYPDFP